MCVQSLSPTRSLAVFVCVMRVRGVLANLTSAKTKRHDY